MLSCPLCCQSYFSSVDLLRTSLISIINRPLICPICSHVQNSLDDLATHLIQHIEVPSQIDCSEVRDVSNVIHNININNTTECESSVVNSFDAVRKCDGNMTEKMATASSPVSVHELELRESPRLNAHIDQMVESFFCNLCDGSFRSQELQQMHMQLVHEINIRPSNEDSELANAHAISPTMHQCNLCPKRFKMIGSLRLHVRMVHGVSHVLQKVRVQNALVCEPASNLVQSTGNEKEIGTGDLIASTSSHANATNLSSIAHNNQSDYYNNNYGGNNATFGNSNSGNSSSGTEQTDLDAEPYNGNNNSKEMIVNTEDRVHKCDICSKCFTTKYFLKKHKRLHTGKLALADYLYGT